MSEQTREELETAIEQREFKMKNVLEKIERQEHIITSTMVSQEKLREHLARWQHQNERDRELLAKTGKDAVGDSAVNIEETKPKIVINEFGPPPAAGAAALQNDLVIKRRMAGNS